MPIDSTLPTVPSNSIISPAEKSFENRRQDYFNFVNNNPVILEGIVNNPTNDKHFIEMVLNPKTEKELELVSSTFTLCSDIFKISIGDIEIDEDINLEESITVKLFVDLINAFKSNNLEAVNIIKQNLNSMTDPKEAARFMFDFFKTFSSDPDGVVYYIAKKSGFDTDSIRDMALFELYLDKAKTITNANRVEKIDYDTIDIEHDERINTTIALSREFHSLCEKEKNKSL